MLGDKVSGVPFTASPDNTLLALQHSFFSHSSLRWKLRASGTGLLHRTGWMDRDLLQRHSGHEGLLGPLES